MSVKLRERTLKDGRKRLYLDIYVGGRRHYEWLEISIEVNDPKRDEKRLLANTIRAKREIEVLSEGHDYTPRHKRNADLIKYWQLYQPDTKFKDQRKYYFSLQKFREFIGTASFSMDRLDQKVCEDFRDFLKNPERSGLSGSTPYDYYKKFRKVLKSAVREGYLRSNPSKEVSLRDMSKGKDNPLREVLTPEELVHLSHYPCGNLLVKKAFLLACYTGMGLAEIRELKWSQINNGILKYQRAKRNDIVVEVTLHPSILRMLDSMDGEAELVFPSIPSTNGVNKSLKYWVVEAGISKKITFYSGRHTFGTMLVRNGADVKTTAELLGHKSFKNTFRYVRAVEEHKRLAIESLPSIRID